MASNCSKQWLQIGRHDDANVIGKHKQADAEREGWKS